MIEKATNLHYNLCFILDHLHFLLVSSSSEGEMNRFTALLLSTKIDSWKFSFYLPALQGCPFFKQWIKSSSILPFARFNSQHLNDFMFSLDSWDQGSSIYSVILFLEGCFIFPLSVNWWTPSLSHWLYSSVIFTLNGLFQHISGARIYFVCPPGMITLAKFISSNIFSCCQSHGISKSPKLKVVC